MRKKMARCHPANAPSADLRSEADKISFVQSASGDTVLVQVYVLNWSWSVTEKVICWGTDEKMRTDSALSGAPLKATSPNL